MTDDAQGPEAVEGWRGRVRRVWWRGVRPWWRRYDWVVVSALAVLAFGLGVVGFWQYYTEVETGTAKGRWDYLYLSLQLFILQSGAVAHGVPPLLEVARWLAPAVAVYTATKALLVILHDQLTVFRLRDHSEHVVVCGLGRKGYILTRALRDAGKRVVVINADEQNPRIERCRELGARVVVGNAADPARAGSSRCCPTTARTPRWRGRRARSSRAAAARG
jgi:hypothetical protein